MPRNTLIRWGCVAALWATTLAGCTGHGGDHTPPNGGPHTATGELPTGIVAATASPQSSTPTGSVAPAGGTTSAAPAAGVAAETLTAGPGASVNVSGTRLPADVRDGLVAHGGELASMSSWDARFETYGLPRVTGPEVAFVAASITTSRAGTEWDRVDAMQWLFMDTAHDGVTGLLAATATAAGIDDGWEMTSESAVVDSADCVTQRYRTLTSSTVWELSGYAYPKFPGMYALGVTRTGIFDASVSPPIVDPTVIGVTAAVAGTIDMVSVVFDRPGAAGSVTTLTTTTTISFDSDLNAAREWLEAGPLAGWAPNPGDGSVLFTGGLGTRWVLADGTVTLTAAGRVAS